MSPSREQAQMAADDAADCSCSNRSIAQRTKVQEYELKLPGWNGSVRAWRYDDSRYVHIRASDLGVDCTLLLEPDEVRALVRGLQEVVGDA